MVNRLPRAGLPATGALSCRGTTLSFRLRKRPFSLAPPAFSSTHRLSAGRTESFRYQTSSLVYHLSLCCVRFVCKGQGSALGKTGKLDRRLKVCCISFSGRRMRQTFSLRVLCGRLPRALPWASMGETVGLQERWMRAIPRALPGLSMSETVGLQERWMP